MYESLKSHSNNFHLYIFSFDDKSYDLLKKLNLESITVISLNEFEDDELLKIKGGRTAREYCWTCTPSIIKHCIKNYNLDNCTYLDADLYFFSDPTILIEEMGTKSVLITEHKYTSEYDQAKMSGKYCVQFMTFKNDKNGMKVLNWWRDACNDWCYARFEDGKFGDQKYLDDWTVRFEGVHELQNLGGGVAPWNVQQYDLNDASFHLIFYHFHNYKVLEGAKIELGSYKLTKENINRLYKPYTKHLREITNNLKLIDNVNDYNGIVKSAKLHWKIPFRLVRRKLKGTYNVFGIHKILDK